MWHPPRFAWTGRKRNSPVAVHHPSVHPALESLEDRTTPATLTITPTDLNTMVGFTPQPLEALGAQDVQRIFTSGLNFNQQMVFDRTGSLYIANQSGGDVIKVTPQGIQSIFASGFNQPKGLAFDSQGNLYVGNQAGNSISKVTPAGVVSTFVASINQPGGLAFDQNGNLYVANEGTGNISEVTPPGVVTVFAHTGWYPNGLAFDRNGNLFVANEGDDNIVEVTPSGTVSTFVPAGAGLDGPAGMAFDLGGNLYVANYNNGTVSWISPAGQVITFASGLSGPTDVAWQSSMEHGGVAGLYISEGFAKDVLRQGPDEVAFNVAPADAAKLAAIGLVLNTDGSFTGQVTSLPASPLTFTVYASDDLGDSGSAAVTLAVQSAIKSAEITVTPAPDVLQTSNSPQQIILHASVRDASTGLPVTEGKIAFTIYNGPDSGSPVLGQTSPLPVDSLGNLAVPFTIPANTPPGAYMILAIYTDQGGSYFDDSVGASLTIQPASPVIPPPVIPPVSPPVTVPIPAPPVRTVPTSPPIVSPSGAQSQSPLVRNTVLTAASLSSAVPGINFTGIGASLNLSMGPSSPFAIAPNMPATQILAGLAVPPVPSPWFSEPTATPTVTSVVLDVPAVPFLPLGFGRPMTPSLAMGAESQAESAMPSLPEVTTTALRLGTSLSDADDSAELFYALARNGGEVTQTASAGEASAQAGSPGDAGE